MVFNYEEKNAFGVLYGVGRQGGWAALLTLQVHYVRGEYGGSEWDSRDKSWSKQLQKKALRFDSFELLSWALY